MTKQSILLMWAVWGKTFNCFLYIFFKTCQEKQEKLGNGRIRRKKSLWEPNGSTTGGLQLIEHDKSSKIYKV